MATEIRAGRVWVEVTAKTQSVSGPLTKLKANLASLGGSIRGLFNLPNMVLGGTLGLIAKKAIDAAAAFEQTRVSFTNLMGDADRATALLSDLERFSSVTPFEPEAVYAAGRALLAYDVEAGQVIDTLRVLGDISAGTGKPLQELVNIYGKMKTKGRAQAEELNQLAEAGIPIIAALAKQYSVTSEEIFKMASAGQIGFADVESALGAMTAEGSKFGGMMEAQSQTLNGVMSTLKGNITAAAIAFTEAWLPALKAVAGAANTVALSLQDINRAKKDAADAKIQKDGGAGMFDALVDTVADGQVFGSSRGAKIYNRTVGLVPGLLAKGARGLGLAGTQSEGEVLTSQVGLGYEVDAARQKKAAKAAQDKADAQEKADLAASQARVSAEKEAATLDGMVSQLQEKLTIQQMLNAGKEREVAVTKALADAQKAVGRELTAQESAKVAGAAGSLYDASSGGNAAEVITKMQEQLAIQQMLNDGKEREVSIMKALEHARDAAGRDLSGDERSRVEAVASALFDARNGVKDAGSQLQVAGSFTADARMFGGGAAADRTAKATEEVSRNTRKTVQLLQSGGTTFS
jgi:tape measure domain-containing protein